MPNSATLSWDLQLNARLVFAIIFDSTSRFALETDLLSSLTPGEAPARDADVVTELPPFLSLPSELLLDIITRVAERTNNRNAKKDLEQLLRSCRRIYIVGLPILVREVKLGKDGVAKLRSLLGGPTGIDKTPFVRSLSVPPGLSWSASLFEVLDKCLVNVEHFSLESFGQKITANIWAKLLRAPKLVSLKLKLARDALKVFEDISIQFPPHVRRLTVELVYGSDPSPLYRMLERCDPDMEEFRAGAIYKEIEQTCVETFPSVACKLTHALFYDWRFAKSAWIQSSRIRELHLHMTTSNFNRAVIKEQLLRMACLESLRISGAGADTGFVLDVVAALPKLKSVVFVCPYLNIWSSGNVSNIDRAFGRKGLKVEIKERMGTSWSEGAQEEKMAWQQLSNVTWTVGCW